MNIFSRLGFWFDNRQELAEEKRIARQLARYIRATAADRDIESVLRKVIKGIADYDKITHSAESYRRNAWTHAAIDHIKNNIAQLKIRVVRGTEDNKKVQAKGALVEWTKEPAPDKTMYDWLAESMGRYLSWGYQLWLHDEPIQLRKKHHLLICNGEHVHVQKNNGTDIRSELRYPIHSFHYKGQLLPMDDCVYWSELDVEGGVVGVSPIEAALHDISADTGAAAFQDNFVHNRFTASGIISPDGDNKSGGSVIQAAAKRWKKKGGSGVKASGRIVGIDAPVRFTPLSIPQSDAQLTEFRRMHRENIAVTMGVPIALFISGQVTYENLDEAKSMLWEFTLMPLLIRLLNILNMKLAWREGRDYAFEFDLSEVEALKPKWDKAGDVAQKWAPFMSDNQILHYIAPVRLPPRPGGNRIYKPANLVEVDEAELPELLKKKKAQVVKAVEKLGIDADVLNNLFGGGGSNGKEEKTRYLTEKDLKEYKSKRVDAGGFTGEERDAIFVRVLNSTTTQMRGLESRLPRYFKKQRDKIEAYLLEKIDNNEPIDDVEEWINWGKSDLDKMEGDGEVQRLANELRPSLVEAVKQGGKEVLADWDPKLQMQFTEKHLKKCRKQALEAAQEVTNSTIKRLKAKVEKVGLAERSVRQDDDEMSKEEMLEFVLAIYAVDYVVNRVNVISATEIHDAFQYGIGEGMEQGGVQEQQWLANFGTNTRGWHASMDGQTVGLDQNFVSGLGNEIPYPGGSGIGAEDCNCICTRWFVRRQQ